MASRGNNFGANRRMAGNAAEPLEVSMSNSFDSSAVKSWISTIYETIKILCSTIKTYSVHYYKTTTHPNIIIGIIIFFLFTIYLHFHSAPMFHHFRHHHANHDQSASVEAYRAKPYTMSYHKYHPVFTALSTPVTAIMVGKSFKPHEIELVDCLGLESALAQKIQVSLLEGRVDSNDGSVQEMLIEKIRAMPGRDEVPIVVVNSHDVWFTGSASPEALIESMSMYPDGVILVSGDSTCHGGKAKGIDYCAGYAEFDDEAEIDDALFGEDEAESYDSEFDDVKHKAQLTKSSYRYANPTAWAAKSRKTAIEFLESWKECIVRGGHNGNGCVHLFHLESGTDYMAHKEFYVLVDQDCEIFQGVGDDGNIGPAVGMTTGGDQMGAHEDENRGILVNPETGVAPMILHFSGDHHIYTQKTSHWRIKQIQVEPHIAIPFGISGREVRNFPDDICPHQIMAHLPPPVRPLGKSYPVWREDAKCSDVCHYFDKRCNSALVTVQEASNVRAECNPASAYPCCSPGGWCGMSAEHCSCPECIDYREVAQEREKLAR